MRGLSVMTALLVASAIPAAASEPYNKSPKWVSGCESASKDQFGERKRQYCFLAVRNDREGASVVMDDNSFVMNFEVILEVDAKGIQIKRPLGRRLCESKGRPTRIAVDGQRIDGLPALKQVQAMLGGQRLVWESQAEWPGCNIAPSGTYLTGMREAMESLKAQWDGIPKPSK